MVVESLSHRSRSRNRTGRYRHWNTHLIGWVRVRSQGDVLPCAICGKYAECVTYASPGKQVESHDICTLCNKKLGFDW